MDQLDNLKSSLTGFYWKIVTPTNHFEDAEEIKKELDTEMVNILKTVERGPLGIPMHAMRAAAFQYAVQCGDVNDEYMLCKKEENDPRNCIKYNNRVSDCAGDFFFHITQACEESFVEFASCLELTEKRSTEYCRKPQLAFDKCLFTKLGFDKTDDPLEWQKKVKTDRPKPHNPLRIAPIKPDPFPVDFDRK